jgi:8-oxo-dGTP pyrophosphatase MutT (NUDIX family)
MHRKQILHLLQDYNPSTDQEIQYKKQMTQFIIDHPYCLQRSCLDGHITASAWVVNSTNTHFLLLHHKKLNEWFQPGGHADGEADLLNVALKETYEETGLPEIKVLLDGIFDIDIHEIGTYKGIPAHLHYDVRFLLQATNDTLTKNEESLDLRWFSKNAETIPNKKPSIMRMYTKWIDIKR